MTTAVPPAVEQAPPTDEMAQTVSWLIHGGSKVGKALSLDTPLPTPSGWTTMGDVQVGDELFNDHGKITRVIAVTPVMNDRPCYRINVSGDSVVADAGHVWKMSNGPGDNTGGWRLGETVDLFNKGKCRALPWTPCLELPDVELPIDPYVLGAWLGDGYSESSHISVHRDDKEIVQLCIERYGAGEFRENPDRGVMVTAYLPGLITKLREIGAVGHRQRQAALTKRVPDVYFRAGTEQRRDLLAGLLDTDGSSGRCVGFASTTQALTQAVHELGSSLGIRVQGAGPGQPLSSWVIYPDGTRGAAKDHYAVGLRGVTREHQVFHLTRKQMQLPESRHKRFNRLYVKSVVQIPSVPVRCIQVDDAHGMFLVGKSMIPTHNSTLADTQPAPRLHFDAEGGMGTRFTQSRKRLWDPTRQEPPVDDGSWDTCVVHVRHYNDVKFGYDWLNSGLHPFLSVTLDSVSEIQQRGIDAAVGKDAMKIQDWGELLREVSALVRQFRDLANHPTRPIQSVMLIAMTTNKDGKWRPSVQGQLADRLPYYVDVCGYLFVQQDETGAFNRRLLVSPHPEYEAGERVGGRLGVMVENPNVSDMINSIFNQDLATGMSATALAN